MRKVHGSKNALVEAGLREFYRKLPKGDPAKKHSRYGNVETAEFGGTTTCLGLEVEGPHTTSFIRRRNVPARFQMEAGDMRPSKR